MNKPVIRRVYRVRLQIGELDQEAYLEAKRMAQCFVLISNIDSGFEKPLAVTGKKKSFSPTGNKIFELFRPVKIVYIEEEGGAKRFLPKRYLELERALKMIGLDLDIFVKPYRTL